MKCALLFLVIVYTHTVLAEKGQSEYESHCIDCHSRMTGGDGHVIYARDNRIVNNMQELKTRVAYCAEGSDADWDQSQIITVTDYLNDQYYHY